MFKVQSKTNRKSAYSTAQTKLKRLMAKTKKKTIEQINITTSLKMYTYFSNVIAIWDSNVNMKNLTLKLNTSKHSMGR